MLDELDRANAIITEFLSLAKNKLVDLKLHNLNDIILNIYPLLKSDALMQNKIILSHLNSIPKLKVDEKEIRQMILNLVRNGLEAMEEKKTLTIETFFKADEVILAIKDEGSGIPTEILDTIGMPFVTTKDTGTGLGLATCYSIASRNNATIKINTSENGTTFFIKFKC
jgi:signal transduction histidine kinase